MSRFGETLAVGAALTLLTGCPPNVQQQAGFSDASVEPAVIQRPVGDLVRFQVKPPVARGTHWLLEAHGFARFVGPDTSHLEWIADKTPLTMEAVVAPWDPVENREKGGQAWLWYSVPEGEAQPLLRDLPVRPLPYKEIAPVTFAAGFSTAPRDPKLDVMQNAERVTVTYRTPAAPGTPFIPQLGAMLVETAGKRVLYGEVKTNFGEREKERVAYDVTFSYAASVPPPVEVVVVEWVNHGLYGDAFDVHRITVGNASDAEKKTTTTPLEPAAPRAE